MVNILWIKKKKPKDDSAVADLPEIWDEYADAGYEKTYLMSCFKELKKKMEELFIACPGGAVLDGGCGKGNMFESILEIMKPSKIVAADWSKSMLNGAKRMAGGLANPGKTLFEFQKVDLTKTFPWPDNTFDAEVFNISIYYLTKPGWGHAVREAYRTTKPGGHAYISIVFRDWEFSKIIKKHTPQVLLASPFGCFFGLKLKKHITKIDVFKERGEINYPSRDEFFTLLEELGFVNLEKRKAFWGGMLIIRAQKPR